MNGGVCVLQFRVTFLTQGKIHRLSETYMMQHKGGLIISNIKPLDV